MNKRYFEDKEHWSKFSPAEPYPKKDKIYMRTFSQTVRLVGLVLQSLQIKSAVKTAGCVCKTCKKCDNCFGSTRFVAPTRNLGGGGNELLTSLKVTKKRIHDPKMLSP